MVVVLLLLEIWKECVHDDPVADESPEDKLTTLEDRHKILSELEVLLSTEEDPAAVGESSEQMKAHVQEVSESSRSSKVAVANVLSEIRQATRGMPCFDQTSQEFFGTRPCLERMHHLFKPLQKFVCEVRIAEGLLSGIPVWGTLWGCHGAWYGMM